MCVQLYLVTADTTHQSEPKTLTPAHSSYHMVHVVHVVHVMHVVHVVCVCVSMCMKELHGNIDQVCPELPPSNVRFVCGGSAHVHSGRGLRLGK